MVKKISGGVGGIHNEGEMEENTQSIRKPKKDMTVEERNLIRAQKYVKLVIFQRFAIGETDLCDISFRLQQIESEFFKHASISETARTLDLDLDVVDQIFHFWILKRKVSRQRSNVFSYFDNQFVFDPQSNRDRPLLPPKTTETERLSQQQQQDMERMKLFVQLRQDLERVPIFSFSVEFCINVSLCGG